jgi:hypothetical protein
VAEEAYENDDGNRDAEKAKRGFSTTRPDNFARAKLKKKRRVAPVEMTGFYLYWKDSEIKILGNPKTHP